MDVEDHLFIFNNANKNDFENQAKFKHIMALPRKAHPCLNFNIIHFLSTFRKYGGITNTNKTSATSRGRTVELPKDVVGLPRFFTNLSCSGAPLISYDQ